MKTTKHTTEIFSSINTFIYQEIKNYKSLSVKKIGPAEWWVYKKHISGKHAGKYLPELCIYIFQNIIGDTHITFQTPKKNSNPFRPNWGYAEHKANNFLEYITKKLSELDQLNI